MQTVGRGSIESVAGGLDWEEDNGEERVRHLYERCPVAALHSNFCAAAVLPFTVVFRRGRRCFRSGLSF